jgi:hypothetical protein
MTCWTWEDAKLLAPGEMLGLRREGTFWVSRSDRSKPSSRRIPDHHAPDRRPDQVIDRQRNPHQRSMVFNRARMEWASSMPGSAVKRSV